MSVRTGITGSNLLIRLISLKRNRAGNDGIEGESPFSASSPSHAGSYNVNVAQWGAHRSELDLISVYLPPLQGSATRVARKKDREARTTGASTALSAKGTGRR
jgi:hypothetical protein